MTEILITLFGTAFLALVGFIGSRLIVSIDKLNIKIAVVIERMDNYEKLMGNHEKRIDKLEENS